MQDGDILQLGVDYQGGHEEMYRCVKMKVEIGRQWGKTADKFKWVLNPPLRYTTDADSCENVNPAPRR
jgi:hypothetical protein